MGDWQRAYDVKTLSSLFLLLAPAEPFSTPLVGKIVALCTRQTTHQTASFGLVYASWAELSPAGYQKQYSTFCLRTRESHPFRRHDGHGSREHGQVGTFPEEQRRHSLPQPEQPQIVDCAWQSVPEERCWLLPASEPHAGVTLSPNDPGAFATTVQFVLLPLASALCCA